LPDTPEAKAQAEPLAGESASIGWSPPDPERPRVSELFIAAVMVSLLAALVLWGGATTEGDSLVVLGEVEPARALDATALPAGAFITVTGHPDTSRVAPVQAMLQPREQGVMLPLREAPGLILHCRHDHPLTDALRRRLRPALDARATGPAADLTVPWTLSGRICDAETYTDPQGASTGASVREFAAERLGLKADQAVRVLEVGTTPADVHRSARTAALFGAGMTLVAIVLWTLAIHGVVHKRKEAGT